MGTIEPLETSSHRRPRGLPLEALMTRTDFQAAFEAQRKGACVPKWGGFYVSEVNVFKDSSRLPIKPFCTSVVYAANPWGPKFHDDDAEDRFREEMREKIRNVFRIC